MDNKNIEGLPELWRETRPDLSAEGKKEFLKRYIPMHSRKLREHMRKLEAGIGTS